MSITVEMAVLLQEEAKAKAARANSKRDADDASGERREESRKRPRIELADLDEKLDSLHGS